MRHLYLFLLFASVSFLASAQNESKSIAHRTGPATAAANFYQSNQMNKYDIKYLKLDLEVAPNTRTVAGSCFYTMLVTQSMDTFAIEFKDNMQLDSVFLNGSRVGFTRQNDHIYVANNPAIAPGTTITAKFYYSGTVINGLAFGSDANSGLVYAATLSESYQAREWFPAKQILNDKIDSTDIWLTTPSPYLAGANGLLKAVVPVAGNKNQFRWSTGYPMSYYMPCLATANYMEYDTYAKPAEMNGDSMLIQHYIVNNPNYFNNIKANLDKTGAFVEKFSELYGLYPFYKEKYGHLHANIGGGMEHQTMSTMQSFGLSIIAHELGHQWFGDHVTCGTWRDIWLNEGFASYSEYLMREKLSSFFVTPAATVMQNTHNSVMSSAGGSVYIPATDEYNEGRIFSSRLTYDKGSAVIHNLRFEMQSDTLFFRTLKQYQSQYANSFATTPQFKAVAELVAGRDFTDFFNQWIYGEGYPTYNVGYYKWGNDTLVMNVTQTTSMPSVTPLFKGLMEYKIVSATGDTTITLNQTQNSQTFRIAYRGTPTSIVVDPNNWVVNAVGQVLPVTLVKFAGEIVKNQALLKWNTANEINFSGFEVERSADGKNFYTIEKVGKSAGAGEKEYNFTDKHMNAVNYYRLKMVDVDGRFSYSNVVELGSNKEDLSVEYLQPTATIYVKTLPATGGKASIKVTDLAGRVVMTVTKDLAEGISQLTTSISQLPKGVYAVEVRIGYRKTVLKVQR